MQPQDLALLLLAQRSLGQAKQPTGFRLVKQQHQHDLTALPGAVSGADYVSKQTPLEARARSPDMDIPSPQMAEEIPRWEGSWGVRLGGATVVVLRGFCVHHHAAQQRDQESAA